MWEGGGVAYLVVEVDFWRNNLAGGISVRGKGERGGVEKERGEGEVR